MRRLICLITLPISTVLASVGKMTLIPELKAVIAAIIAIVLVFVSAQFLPVTPPPLAYVFMVFGFWVMLFSAMTMR